MSRPLRIQFPAAVYHVINRGAARQPTFVDDEDSQAFLDTLAEAYRLWQIEIFAYCLMRNHYHLCLRTPKGNLSRVMRHGAWSLGSGITIDSAEKPIWNLVIFKK
jgi:putative transposase